MKGGKGPKQQWAKCVVWVCVDGRARIGQSDAEAFLPPRRVVDPGGRDSSSPSVLGQHCAGQSQILQQTPG